MHNIIINVILLVYQAQAISARGAVVSTIHRIAFASTIPPTLTAPTAGGIRFTVHTAVITVVPCLALALPVSIP